MFPVTTISSSKTLALLSDIEKNIAETLSNLYSRENFDATEVPYKNFYTSSGLEISKLDQFFNAVAD
jgi:hypothetical protein